MKKLVFIALLITSAISMADEAQTKPLSPTTPIVKELPTTEKEFVDAINSFTKEEIIAQLGEPAKAEDVKLKDSGKIVASIWYYHNINTAPDGSYYPTTELDFIEGKVVQVVYMNNDGTESEETNKTYDMPGAESAL